MSTKSIKSLKEHCTAERDWAIEIEEKEGKDITPAYRQWLRAWAVAHNQILEQFTN